MTIGVPKGVFKRRDLIIMCNKILEENATAPPNGEALPSVPSQYTRGTLNDVICK